MVCWPHTALVDIIFDLPTYLVLTPAKINQLMLLSEQNAVI